MQNKGITLKKFVETLKNDKYVIKKKRFQAALQAETIFLVTMASRLEFGCYMISNNVLNIVFMVFPTLKLR